MSENPYPATAIAYARISLDKTGEALGVERQRDEIQAWAAERGICITATYTDNSISATSGAARPGFEAMVSSTEKHVIVWHSDRLLRRIMDLERVLNAEKVVHQVKAGTMDLATPAGRVMARTLVSFASYEIEQKTDRQRVQHGRYIGTYRGFGNEKTGALREDEAALIRAGAEALLTGQATFYSLAQEWNKAGVLTARNGSVGGGRWSASTVNQLFGSERLCGRQTYGGETHPLRDWTAVLDAETFEKVQSVRRFKRTGVERRTGVKGNQHPLTGLAACGMCGRGFTVRYTGGSGDQRKYRCPEPGHVTVSAAALEKAVYGYAYALLTYMDTSTEKAKAEEKSVRLEALTLQRGEEVAEFGRWRSEALKARLTPADIRTAEEGHREALNAIDAQVNALRDDLRTGFSRLIGDPPESIFDRPRWWATGIAAMPAQNRRELLGSLFTAVVVSKIGQGRRFREVEHVTWNLTPYGADLLRVAVEQDRQEQAEQD